MDPFALVSDSAVHPVVALVSLLAVAGVISLAIGMHRLAAKIDAMFAMSVTSRGPAPGPGPDEHTSP